jgi:Zn-finger nucleic acid-binding protein
MKKCVECGGIWNDKEVRAYEIHVSSNLPPVEYVGDMCPKCKANVEDA